MPSSATLHFTIHALLSIMMNSKPQIESTVCMRISCIHLHTENGSFALLQHPQHDAKLSKFLALDQRINQTSDIVNFVTGKSSVNEIPEPNRYDLVVNNVGKLLLRLLAKFRLFDDSAV